MTPVVEVLTRARALVVRGHSKCAGARDVDGNPVSDWQDPRACAWCVVSAVAVVAKGGVTQEPALQALTPFTAHECGKVAWSDAPERTQAEVLAAFDRAIAAEVARG